MNKQNHPLPVHPFLLAVYPLLAYYLHNGDELRPDRLLIPLLVCLGGGALLFLLFRFAMRSAQKASLLTSALLFIFFSYGHIHQILSETAFGARHRLLLALTAGAGILVFIAVGRSRRSLDAFVQTLNAVSILLVVWVLVGIGKQRLTHPRSVRVSLQRSCVPATVDNRPDIYYIILDRYASAETLKDFYDFDNTPFLDYLRSNGFYIAEQSRCNYPATHKSLASSLNMNYLEQLISDTAESEEQAVYSLLDAPLVPRMLKSVGYSYIHIGSWWGATEKSSLADKNVRFGMLDYFSRAFLFQTTALQPFYSDLLARPFHRKGTLAQFTALSDIAASTRARFVFAHILLPHPPYVFDKDGSTVTRSMASRRSEAENYLNQLQFLNTRLKQLIPAILQRSTRPPLIIIQADEGPYLYKHEKQDKNASRKRYGILNAMYFPGTVDTDGLYPTISPVNTFRFAFARVFGASCELLPDECR
jgi:hypothetical protein